MEILQEFISASQAAKLSGYNPDYISSLIRTGKIRGKKVGKNWVTTTDELNRYLHSVGGKLISGARASRVQGRSRITRMPFVVVAIIIAGFLALASYGVYAVVYQQAYHQVETQNAISTTAAAGNVVTSLPQL